ncbi:MAG: hypothetical protein ACHQ2Z_14285, partial [Elusimicrobiota bacterium]
MRLIISWVGLAAMALAFSALAQDQGPSPAEQTPPSQPAMDAPKDASVMIKTWPVNSRVTGQRFIEKYGPPDEANDSRLVWNDRQQWSQIRLFREGVSDDFPTTHKDIVQNTILYDVSQDKAGEVIKFDPAMDVDRISGTLSARSDSEAANILALNLADEIVRGKRDVDSARDFMRATLRNSTAGKSSPYMDHLMFPVADRGPVHN